MPVWHKATRKWVEEGRLVLLGVIQEQHAERCRLFAQWQQFDWPILHDPINSLQLTAVPIVLAIDEHGIVRSRRPRPESLEDEFLDREFADDAASEDGERIAKRVLNREQHVNQLRRAAAESNEPLDWRALGDAIILWQAAAQASQAIEAYSRVLQLDTHDADALFRLGVAYRVRFDSAARQEFDFQSAVKSWEGALQANPNQYIWRRRIQQYGPRLEKPYPFYDWCQRAQQEIAARGETPIQLQVALGGAEIAAPAKNFAATDDNPQNPDPAGEILRDEQRWIRTEVTLVPTAIAPGQTARGHITFYPDAERKVYWNNESEPLRVWLDAPDGWRISQRLLEAAAGEQPESNEPRQVDFEIEAPSAFGEAVKLQAYALYYVCEGEDGMCVYRRQDIPIALPRAPSR